MKKISEEKPNTVKLTQEKTEHLNSPASAEGATDKCSYKENRFWDPVSSKELHQ